jgi:hypothetical protein
MDKIDFLWLMYTLVVIAMILFYSATRGEDE